MTKRLTGAVLNAAVIRHLREELTAYGLPMDEYAGRVAHRHSIGSDMQPILAVEFTRKSNGALISFDNVFPADDGSINQRDMPTLQ